MIKAIDHVASYRKRAQLRYQDERHDWFEPYQKRMKKPTVDWLLDWPVDKPIASHSINKQLLICDIDFFVQEYYSLAQQYIFTTTSPDWLYDHVALYVHATWQRHMVIYAQSGLHEQIVDIASMVAKEYTVLLITIIVEQGASIIIRDTRSRQSVETAWCSYQVIVRSGGRCRFVYHNQHSNQAIIFNSLTALVEAHAQFEYEGLYAYAAFLYQHIKLYMQGSGGMARVRAISDMSYDQQHILTTSQIHELSQASSSVIIKGVLDQQASLYYSGMIDVGQQAHQTHAVQEHKALVLDRRAQVQSIPGLQVLANQVSCAHGAAISSIDQEQLMYLQARGFSLENAKKALIQGFLVDILSDNCVLSYFKD